MPDVNERLAALRERLGVRAHLDQAAALLAWDESTYLPPGGAEARGQQLATLARLRQAHLAEPGLVALLEDLEGAARAGAAFAADGAALLRLTRRELDRALRLRADLVAALARHRVRARAAWVRARTNDDFAAFAPELRTMVGLQREQAAALAGTRPAYDVLHDLYEPGSTAARVEAVFRPLRGEVVELLAAIRSSPVRPTPTCCTATSRRMPRRPSCGPRCGRWASTSTAADWIAPPTPSPAASGRATSVSRPATSAAFWEGAYPRRRAARRPPRLPAGRALGGGSVRQLPHLHVGDAAERAAVGGHGARSGRPRALVRAGRFAPVLGWLVERVHRQGSRYEPGELIERATGAPLSAEPFLRYLRAKHGALYRLG